MNFNLFLLLENNNIKGLLGNNQGYYHLFNKFHEKEGVPLESLQQLIDNIKRLKPLIKKNLVTFDKYEDLIDYLIEIEEDSNVKKIKDLFPKKSKFLITPEVESIIIDNKYKYDVFKNFLKKISYYVKNPKNFAADLSDFIKNMSGEFNLNVYLSKAKESECLVVEATETELILVVNNYTSMKKIGTQSWCIVRDEYMFDRYVKGRVQFVIFDFTKNVSDIKSMIGVTLNPNGSLYAAHFKNDSKCELGYIEDNFPKVLENTDMYFSIANLEIAKSLDDLKDIYTILKNINNLIMLPNFIDIDDGYQLEWLFKNMDSIDANAKNVASNIILKLKKLDYYSLDQVSIIIDYDLDIKIKSIKQRSFPKLKFDINKVYNYLNKKNVIIQKSILELLNIDPFKHIENIDYKFIDKSLYDNISFEEHFKHLENENTLSYIYDNYDKNINKFDYYFSKTKEYKKMLKSLEAYEDIKLEGSNILFRPVKSSFGDLFRLKHSDGDNDGDQIIKMLEYTYDMKDVDKEVYTKKFEDKLEDMYFEYIINDYYHLSEAVEYIGKELFIPSSKKDIVYSDQFELVESFVESLLGDDFKEIPNWNIKRTEGREAYFKLYFTEHIIKEIVLEFSIRIGNYIAGINYHISKEVRYYDKITTDDTESYSITGYSLRPFYVYLRLYTLEEDSDESLFYDIARIRQYYEIFK